MANQRISMNSGNLDGWKKVLENFPWFAGEGRYPIPAYSEFMPAPRIAFSPYHVFDDPFFSEDDPYGWPVSEMEEEYELKPGLENIARQILPQLIKLGRGLPAPHIAGHKGRNLQDNPYWPPELAARAGHLDHERYLLFLSLALSKTQDDLGRVGWTFFGNSEQGPERAFWKGFYSAPGQELPKQKFTTFFCRLLARVYGEKADTADELGKIGFRILPIVKNDVFADWPEESLPSVCNPYLLHDRSSLETARYLLTFKPFHYLPAEIKKEYLEGNLAL
jgi:hypothetical protein